ncbi:MULTISPECIES: hypothetical protein [unclassified Streptomyces]|uniref:hypothetical protein n=1 Tax=unclassified Streptomyces TaxID=2593676 RepID=UPI0036F60330
MSHGQVRTTVRTCPYAPGGVLLPVRVTRRRRTAAAVATVTRGGGALSVPAAMAAPGPVATAHAVAGSERYPFPQGSSVTSAGVTGFLAPRGDKTVWTRYADGATSELPVTPTAKKLHLVSRAPGPTSSTAR